MLLLKFYFSVCYFCIFKNALSIPDFIFMLLFLVHKIVDFLFSEIPKVHIKFRYFWLFVIFAFLKRHTELSNFGCGILVVY